MPPLLLQGKRLLRIGAYPHGTCPILASNLCLAQQDCWRGWVDAKVSEGIGCLRMCCQEPKCKMAVPLDIIREARHVVSQMGSYMS